MCTLTPVPDLLLSETVEAGNTTLLHKLKMALYFEHLWHANWGKVSEIADAVFEL